MRRGARPHYPKQQKPRKYNWYYANLSAEVLIGGWKQVVLARILGMSNVTLCHILRGTYTLHKPPFTEIQKRDLAFKMGLSRRYLFNQKTIK